LLEQTIIFPELTSERKDHLVLSDQGQRQARCHVVSRKSAGLVWKKSSEAMDASGVKGTDLPACVCCHDWQIILLQDVLQLTSLCFIVLYNVSVRFSFIPKLCSITAMLFTANNSAFS